MFTVKVAGLETSVQDYPGRLGYRNQGFPPSGPMDSWSFRLANLLVGNKAGAAALECQYMGPTVEFVNDGFIAITGADMQARIDDVDVPLWTTLEVQAGQVLQMKFAKHGIRSYIAFAGGIDTPAWLGSQSTFHKAGVGGVEGHAIQVGQTITVNHSLIGTAKVGSSVIDNARPNIEGGKVLAVSVVLGPNDDWLDAAGIETFLSSEWKLSAKSDRTGFRLEGPDVTFADKATNKGPEHGSEPSNIIDQGYPVGAINLAGQTPIILVNDGPSMGGFINPFTVPSCEFWKLAHAKPAMTINFDAISVEQAQFRSREIAAVCSISSVVVP